MTRPHPPQRRWSPALGPSVLVIVWSLLFAAPHLYWAMGGRAGLGAEAAEADAALGETAFFIYNLAVTGLAMCGATIAVVLRRAGPRLRNLLLLASAVASALLLLRGAIGLTLLGLSVLRSTFDGQTPVLLLAIEPWFLIGGLAYGAMVLRQRRVSIPGRVRNPNRPASFALRRSAPSVHGRRQDNADTPGASPPTEESLLTCSSPAPTP